MTHAFFAGTGAGTPSSRPHRLEYIDGLRGLAIAMVVLYHAFARWPDSYPYKSIFAQYAIFDTRITGVQLFFIISGFVIVMTLEKSGSFMSFLFKRWIRLFPAMLACSLIIIGTAFLFPERPAGAPNLTQVIPGLTFLSPATLRVLTGGLFAGDTIEGAFWSLFLEVRFYLIFGTLFFIFGRRVALVSLLAIYLLALAVLMLTDADGLFHFAALVRYEDSVARGVAALGFGEFIWFFAGALYFEYTCTGKRAVLAAAFGSSLLGALASGQPIGASLFIIFVFLGAVLIPAIGKLLCLSPFQFIGFISYPLYLVHENMMVAMITKIGRAFPFTPHLLIPLLPIASVVALGYVVARWVEPPTRTAIHQLLTRFGNTPLMV
ncbi:acyltransferase [Ancylobacter sp. 6x-1]|uniref:Acyltransferase n=1 Tax=Ancylobacter crimeensis TaxID=2579147 RepID=A0ABT0DCV5_9HYPH|nr:acyltransferase [Ancylobacter crimeensis]MCK0197796.1 acyltransferase [Ancylobacter crimeensis]